MQNTNIQKIIEEMLLKMGVKYESITHEENSSGGLGVLFTVHSSAGDTLIGKNGETLRALTFVLKRIIERTYGEEATHFLLDVNGYQTKKLEELKRNATMLAERARALQSPVALPPMNSYERMVVHDMFSGDRDLATYSEGFGRERHVVIAPKGIKANGEDLVVV